MPSTVYKGDLTEVSFGHETALRLDHNYSSRTFTNATCDTTSGDATVTMDDTANIEAGMSVTGTGVPAGATVLSITDGTTFELSANATATNSNQTFTFGDAFGFTASTVTAADETSVITLSGNGSPSTPVTVGGVLKVPIGMLVGVKVSIVGNGTGGFTPDDGRLFTVIAQTKNTFTVTPALDTTQATDSVAGDALIFHSLAMPSVDVNSGHNDNANSSTERSLLDQFVGLTAAVTLPETKVDLKRYHVVGLGRDVAVQVPGRFVNQGGSFEVNMHNPRWLYYCLGMEAVDVGSTYNSLTTNTDYTINVTAGTKAGATTIPFNRSGGGSGDPTFSGGSAVGAGDYVIIKDTDITDLVTYKEADTADVSVFGAVANPESVYFDRTEKSEIRRIVAITSDTIFLDDALLYPHDDNTPIHFARFGSGSTLGSPDRASTGALTNGVTRLLYSRSHVPSFAMEVSIRRRDAEDDTAVDGSSTDTKQLTRVFRGCKVKDFSLTADTDAALRLNVNFDSTLCYTDTGRLEASNKGDRYDAHRMFEDTANSDAKRKESGIAPGTQKPFMFYNGTVTFAGRRIGQVVSFTLNGSTGVQQFYTINGAAVTDATTDQTPFAGSRNASLSVEGKTEYSMDMEIIVEDPVFYHEMRRAVGRDPTTADMIRLSFTKPGTASGRESLDIMLDDYYITEAGLPIPEDKGPIRAPLKVLPKAIRVVSTDTLFHC